MATRGMSEFKANGVDYTVNDPNVAPEFNAANAYSKGDYVNYQGNLYRLTADHAANTTWENTSKTDAILLGAELATEKANRKTADDTETTARENGDASVLNQIAPVFDADTAYTKGQYVTYNGTLYKLTADHTAGTTWANTSKTAVKMSAEMNSKVAELETADEQLKSALKGVMQIKDATAYTWDLGKNIASSGDEITSQGVALTKYIKVPQMTTFKKTIAGIGYNDEPDFVMIHEFDSQLVWKRRTSLNDFVSVGDDCEYVKIAYGYSNNTGISITFQILSTYFSVGIFEEAAFKRDLNSVEDIVYIGEEIDFSIAATKNGYINDSNQWFTPTGSASYLIPAKPDKREISVQANESYNSYLAFLTNDTVTEGQAPNYCAGTTRITIYAGSKKRLSIPSGCNYICFRKKPQADYDATPAYACIGDVDTRIDQLKSEFYHSMKLNTSFVKEAYPSTIIDSAIQYTDSTKSVSIPNIVSVVKGQIYNIKITNGLSPESVNNRNAVVVDTSNIIKQVISIETTANSTNVSTFVANTDGYLVLCVDKNYTNIEIDGFEMLSDIYNNAQQITGLRGNYIYKNSYSIPAYTTIGDYMPITFKPGCTYVIVLEANIQDGYVDGNYNSMGVSGTNIRRSIWAINGLEVFKFKVTNEITSYLWFRNGTDSAKTFSFTVEEWNNCDEWVTSEPDTITIASNTSSAPSKYISRYICDGIDDQVEIQAAINELSAKKGGRVLLCDGIYNIDTVTDSENSEIGYIGLNLPYIENFHYISIEGVSKPIRVGDGSTSRTIDLGAVINLTADAVSNIDNEDHITIIGALPVDNEYLKRPRALNLTIKNIGINIPTNEKAIRCIDAEYCGALEIENVAIGIGKYGTLSTTQNLDCIGIRGLGGWNYGIYYTIRCVKVLGVGIAFDLGGEHLIMEQCAVRFSWTPYRFYKYGITAQMAHPLTLINCCEEQCKTSLVFGANSMKPLVNIIDYNIEYRSTSAFNRSQKAIEEHSGDIYGSINFAGNDSTHVNISDLPFWESGSGVNMRTVNSVDPLYGTTANRPVHPYMMQQYYDTTIGKQIMFNGTNWTNMNGETV